MSTNMPTCPCGNDDLRVSASIPVTFVVNPSELTLEIYNPGHNPDYHSWPVAWCPECDAYGQEGGGNIAFDQVIARAEAALRELDATVHCE
jgi:hypothetical protein